MTDVDWNNVVCTAIFYRLDSPGIESPWRVQFSATVQTESGSAQPPVQWVEGLFPGGKAGGM
jgi:hypothetical protein